jgi:hypothetical protein
MTSEFLVYLQLGFEHIVDLRGYDHILFIVALGAGYALGRWRELLILVTAFTLGHSLTLALATLDLVSIDSTLVEVLIPLTILVTALYDVVEVRRRRPPDAARPGSPEEDEARQAARGAASGVARRRMRRIKYALALGFGLIHGLGFSTFLRAVLGAEESITLPLFAFNVGLEVGQILILGVLLLLTHAAVRWTPLPPTRWTLFLSGTTAAAALALLVERVVG